MMFSCVFLHIYKGSNLQYVNNKLTVLTLYARMTNIGTLITNDDYSRHGHHRAVSALYPVAT